MLRLGSYTYKIGGNAGLVTNKTLGYKPILRNIFIRDHSLVEASSMTAAKDRGALVSAVQSIFDANFAPDAETEQYIEQGNFHYHLNTEVKLNQLLFLSAESLAVLTAIHNCNDYSDLATVFDLYMPKCLEIVNTLDYTDALKCHVSCLLTYLWKTTKAISEELNNDNAETTAVVSNTV
jgi:hypothetical protein